MKNIFKVAVLQKNAIYGDCKTNAETVISEMKEAGANGADILLLPECFITGYSLPATNSEALSDDSEYILKLCETARKLNMGVIATSLTKGENKPQNSALVISKNGEILMKYSKVHTCDFSLEACLESGDEFLVCEFDGVKLGVMICYDREYPESARVLMMKGAEIILVPNDCGTMRPRLAALSTRAYENMVGVVMANPPGEDKGNSCAYSPICWDNDGRAVDNTLLLADEQSSKLFYAEFDMDEIRAYRSDEMMGNTYRKVRAYAELLNDEIKEPFIRENQK